MTTAAPSSQTSKLAWQLGRTLETAQRLGHVETLELPHGLVIRARHRPDGRRELLCYRKTGKPSEREVHTTARHCGFAFLAPTKHGGEGRRVHYLITEAPPAGPGERAALAREAVAHLERHHGREGREEFADLWAAGLMQMSVAELRARHAEIMALPVGPARSAPVVEPQPQTQGILELTDGPTA